MPVQFYVLLDARSAALHGVAHEVCASLIISGTCCPCHHTHHIPHIVKHQVSSTEWTCSAFLLDGHSPLDRVQAQIQIPSSHRSRQHLLDNISTQIHIRSSHRSRSYLHSDPAQVAAPDPEHHHTSSHHHITMQVFITPSCSSLSHRSCCHHHIISC